MKKRLLSAALALAMVLTMLPLAAFADVVAVDDPGDSQVTASNVTPAGNGTETVTFLTSKNTSYTYDGDPTFPGWYVAHVTPANSQAGTPAKTVYVKVTTGVVAGGKYYSEDNANKTNLTTNNDGTTTDETIYNWTKPSTGSAYMTGLKTGITVIGGTITIDVVNATSQSVDIYGGTVTVKQTNTNNSTAKLTSLTVTNSRYANTNSKGTVKLDASNGTAIDGLTSLSVTNTKFDSSATISMASKAANDGGLGHSITLTNVEGGAAITLNGVGTNDPVTRANQTVNITNSTIGTLTVKGAANTVNVTNSTTGKIDVQGTTNTVTLNEVKGASNTPPDVDLQGTGGNLYVRGGSTLGAVTVSSGATETTTAAPSNITVDVGSTVASINSSGVSSEQATGRNTVSISGTVTDAVNLKNSTVTVNGGQTGNLSVDTGTVTVSGNRAGVGDVTLKSDATFTLSGTNCTVGALKVATGGSAATVTFNVPNDPSNTLGSESDSVGSAYTKATIKGGTWKTAVPAVNLDTSLMYQLAQVADKGPYTYYTSDQLGEAIIKQGTLANGKLTKVGDESASKSVTFMNGSTVWGTLSISPNVSIPKLPTQMNSVSTPYWSDGEFSNLAGNYSVPENGATLNAGSSVSSDVTALTGVRIDTDKNANAPDVKATLVGNVITLTGAVEKTDTKFDLILETDAVTYNDTDKKEVPVEIELSLIFDPSTKALTVAYGNGQSLGNGVVIENTFNAIKLSDGTRYTFNGSGLVVRSKNIYVRYLDEDQTSGIEYENGFSTNDIEVVVSASGWTSTTALKNQIIALINGANAKFEWEDSAAVKQAVNAALATISDANVQTYINNASAQARRDYGLGTNADTAYQDDGAEVWLVPYLEVNVTSYQPNTINPALNATLTIKWRVEVHPGDDNSGATPYAKEAANLVSEDGVYIAKAGVNLPLDSDLGDGVAITFVTGISAKFVHQESIYDYEIGSQACSFTLTHAVNGNLGKIVLDTKEPLIQVGKKDGSEPEIASDADNKAYFSTLQAAVDAAVEGDIVVINSSYTGSTSINMTGKARTIYVQANGKNVVVANASGSLVEVNNAGTLYTIRLNRDNTTAVSSTSVSVSSATGGSARTSVTAAKPGETVTITTTASTGYVANTPTVRDNNGKAVDVSGGSNGVWTFVVPAGATSITVTPRFVLSTGLPYTDVTDTSLWYFAGVKYCYDTQVNGNSLMQGVTTTTFAPANQFTRAQMVQILWNMAGQPAARTTNYPFSDVIGTGSDWAKEPIIWAAENGYVEGYPDGKFHPEVLVSRQDMVLILYRYAKKPATGSGSLAGYYDGNNVGSWATDAVRWATSMGILSGTNSVSLNGYIYGPTKAKRCEVAVTIANFYKMYG